MRRETVTDTGKPAAAPGEAQALRAALPRPTHGVYAVNWRTVSKVDGHITSGSFAFGIGARPPRAGRDLLGVVSAPEFGDRFHVGCARLGQQFGIFVVGGVLSVWEGAQHLLHPSAVQAGVLGFAVLGRRTASGKPLG
jgi:CopC domain-containing protein